MTSSAHSSTRTSTSSGDRNGLFGHDGDTSSPEGAVVNKGRGYYNNQESVTCVRSSCSRQGCSIFLSEMPETPFFPEESSVGETEEDGHMFPQVDLLGRVDRSQLKLVGIWSFSQVIRGRDTHLVIKKPHFPTEYQTVEKRVYERPGRP